MTTQLTKELVETAIRTYMSKNGERPPAVGIDAIEDVPEMAGMSWQLLDVRMREGKIAGIEKGVTLSRFKKEVMGLASIAGRGRIIANVSGREIIETIIEHISRHKVRPVLDNGRIDSGPLKDRLNWSSLFSILSRGVEGISNNVELDALINTTLDALEDAGADLGKGAGSTRARTKVKIPRDLDKEAVIASVFERLSPDAKPREKPAPTVDAKGLHMFMLTRMNFDEIKAACADNDAIVFGIRVGDLTRAFAAKTVIGAEKFTHGQSCSSLLEFAQASSLIPRAIEKDADSAPQPKAA